MAIITGTIFADVLFGFSSGDRLIGLDGNDRLSGRGGKDVLNGGRGDDILAGGLGADVFIGMHGADTFVGGGATQGDTANYSFEVRDAATRGIKVNLSGISRAGLAPDKARDSFGFIDSVKGVPNVVGTNFADTIHGGGNNNKLTGLGGADFLFGHGGNDILKAGAGNDVLRAGDGNDLLEGGLGRDTMTGGNDSDRFDFNRAADARGDLIRDFQSGLDKIDLATINSTTSTGQFVWVDPANLGAAFTGANGQLRFAGGFLQGDLNGDMVADFRIQIVGSLAAGDVIL